MWIEILRRFAFWPCFCHHSCHSQLTWRSGSWRKAESTEAPNRTEHTELVTTVDPPWDAVCTDTAIYSDTNPICQEFSHWIDLNSKTKSHDTWSHETGGIEVRLRTLMAMSVHVFVLSLYSIVVSCHVYVWTQASASPASPGLQQLMAAAEKYVADNSVLACFGALQKGAD